MRPGEKLGPDEESMLMLETLFSRLEDTCWYTQEVTRLDHSVAIGLDERGTGSRETSEKTGEGRCWPELSRDRECGDQQGHEDQRGAVVSTVRGESWPRCQS